MAQQSRELRFETQPAMYAANEEWLTFACEVSDKEWRYQWVRSSQSMVRAGDPKAVALFEAYNQVIKYCYSCIQRH